MVVGRGSRRKPATLDCKEIQPVHSEGDQPWDFFGGNDAKAETPVLWPPHAKSWLIGKDSDAGRDWGREEKGTTEDEMAGWHHWLDGHESGWTPGVGDGQGGLACCNSWGHKESEQLIWSGLVTTERLIWSDLVGGVAWEGGAQVGVCGCAEADYVPQFWYIVSFLPDYCPNFHTGILWLFQPCDCKI